MGLLGGLYRRWLMFSSRKTFALVSSRDYRLVGRIIFDSLAIAL